MNFPPDVLERAGLTPCGEACRAHWASFASARQAEAARLDREVPPLLLNLSLAAEPVSGMLFGLNMELVRHNMFAGLSAQLLANRLFGSGNGTFPPRWHPIGSPALESPGLSGRAGTYAVACTSEGRRHATGECGIYQTRVGAGFESGPGDGSAIALQSGRCYTARLVLRAAARGNCSTIFTAELTDDERGVSLASWAAADVASSWSTRHFNFTSSISTMSATLRVAGRAVSGDRRCSAKFSIGAVSLMPCDHVHGARRDVLRLLRRLGFRGPLRWPGGCYSSIASDWRDGILPPDERPPVYNPPGPFCGAVSGGQFGYTDGLSENWPGVDEYFALCREIGATPAIGVTLQFGTPDEVESARALLEYTNGDASGTPMGRLRAARGVTEPLGARVVYLGNEIGAQLRYSGGRVRRVDGGECNMAAGACPPATPREYRDMLANLTAALRGVDPSAKLVASNAAPNISSWDGSGSFDMGRREMEEWLKPPWGYMQSTAVREALFAHSYHLYIRQPDAWDPASMTSLAKAAARVAMPALHYHRRRLDTVGRAKSAKISLDEWGVGPPWRVRSFGAPHAMFATAFLLQLLRHAKPLRLASANFFEPVNEGAIWTGPWDAGLTPLGEALALLSVHQGQRLLPLSGSDPDDMSGRGGDVEAVATVARGGASVLFTLANLDAASAHTRAASLPLAEASRHASPSVDVLLSSTELRATGVDPVSSGWLGAVGRFHVGRAVLSANCLGARDGEAAEAEARHTGRGGSGELILRCSQQSTLRLEAQLPPYSVTQVHISIKHDKE